MMSGNDDFEVRLEEEVGEDVAIHDTKDPDEVFLTSRSRLKLALLEYKDGVRSLRSWINPFILLVTVGSILLVGNFQQNFGLSSEFWRAAYFIIGIISIVWLVHSIYTFYKNKNKANINSVIRELKKNGD